MLINRNYRRLWFGQAISVVGDEVFDTTLLLWVGVVLLANRSYAPAVSSIVLVITSVVIVTVGPLAGVFVDRWDKRTTLLRTDLIRAVLIGILIVVSLWPRLFPLPVTLAVIGVVVALATAASQFFNPARTIVVADVVPPDQLGRATGYGQTASAMATVIGPPMAAPLLVGIGVPAAITVNALSFLVSYVAIRSVRFGQRAQAPVPAQAGAPAEEEVVAVTAGGGGAAGLVAAEATAVENPPVEPGPAPTSSVRSEFMAGLRFMFGSGIVRATLVTAIVVNLGAGALAALDVYFVGENLHTDPKWFGVLAGAFGVGSVVGALVGGYLGDKLGHGRVVASGLFAAGLFTIGYSRSSSVVIAAVLIALLGVSIGVVNAAVVPVVLKGVPREYLGRVFAVVVPANRFGAIFSILLASVLVSTVLRGLNTSVAGVHLGRIDSVFLVAGIIIAASGVYFGLATRRR